MTLERKTPMRRGGELRRTPMRARARAPRKRARDTGPTSAAKDIVAVRAAGRCERCGGTLAGPDGYSRHHRHPRRMGGSKRAALNTPANIVLICGSGTTGCHGDIESRREAAYADGLLLHDGQDPELVPVLLACPVDGWPRLLLLATDGTWSYAEDTTSPAHTERRETETETEGARP